jgi:predicted LPLAT superfamily acyltransferase
MCARGRCLLAALLGAILVAPALGQVHEPEKLALAIVEKLIAAQFSEIAAQFNPEAAAVSEPGMWVCAEMRRIAWFVI